MTERYRGMNAHATGTLTDTDHVWQSVSDILLTPIGSRLMRRNYGSLCVDLLDSPKNEVTRMQLMSAIAIALATWEPRIMLQTVNVNYVAGGGVSASIAGVLTETLEKTSGNVQLQGGANAVN